LQSMIEKNTSINDRVRIKTCAALQQRHDAEQTQLLKLEQQRMEIEQLKLKDAEKEKQLNEARRLLDVERKQAKVHKLVGSAASSSSSKKLKVESDLSPSSVEQLSLQSSGQLSASAD
jgi:hypothetical protein